MNNSFSASNASLIILVRKTSLLQVCLNANWTEIQFTVTCNTSDYEVLKYLKKNPNKTVEIKVFIIYKMRLALNTLLIYSFIVQNGH